MSGSDSLWGFVENHHEWQLSLCCYCSMSPPAPRGTGSFHQVEMIYIFIDTDVCFLTVCAFKRPATPGHASWGKGQRVWNPLQAEAPGVIFSESQTRERTCWCENTFVSFYILTRNNIFTIYGLDTLWDILLGFSWKLLYLLFCHHVLEMTQEVMCFAKVRI